MDRGNRIKPINNDVYDIMIKYPNSFKLAHRTSSAELSAWHLLKKYAVVEEQCPITKEVGEKGGKLIFNKYLHFSFTKVVERTLCIFRLCILAAKLAVFSVISEV